MKLTNKLILITILTLATILRIYHLDTLPSLNPDEAALGYNAYSLLQTGKDEHGVPWPLHFKSFGDYKPGGYVYLAMPFIKVIGLTPLAVRLPNLILSILTIYILYKLISRLTSNIKLSFLSAFVLAISPWHIHFSRGAWESNSALFFILLGIYWFYQKRYYLFLIPFIASLYIYHSARLVSPLLVLFLLTTNWKLVINNWRIFFVASLIAVTLTLPVALSFLKSGGTTRLGGVGLTADYGPIARAEELLNQHGNTLLVNRVIHNKRLLYTISWAQKYTSHFDLNFLFINGDSVPRSKSPDMGQLYLLELPLVILGITFLFKNKTFRPLRLLVISWLLIAPLPSSLTFQAPSALRALPMIIPLSIIIASGLYYLLELTGKYFPHNIFLITVFYIYSLYYFIDAYSIHSPLRYPFAWNTGFSQVIPFVQSQKARFANIYFTDSYDQPYILYLFYSQYPPKNIQSQIHLTPPDNFGFSTVSKIDNINFGKIIWDQIPQNSLIISGLEPLTTTPIKTFDFPNGSPGFKIYVK